MNSVTVIASRSSRLLHCVAAHANVTFPVLYEDRAAERGPIRVGLGPSRVGVRTSLLDLDDLVLERLCLGVWPVSGLDLASDVDREPLHLGC